MRVGIIDIGSNTVRLLVASRGERGVVAVREERAASGLALDIERTGAISKGKLRDTVELTRSLAQVAAEEGAERLQVLVAAPGRQAENGGELIAALAAAGTGAHVHGLSAEEEGRFAFHGAVAALPCLPASIAVCDVGGGSTQLVFGTPLEGPVWFRSLDIGSRRLAQRCFAHDPPRPDEVAAAEAEVEHCFTGLAPPLPRAALATGGTARALRRLVGRTLSARALAQARKRVAGRSSLELAASYGLEPWRAETLAAGAIALAEAQRRLSVPLVVARAGLREGAALELLDRVAAEAA